jgi:hypothetical protein
VGGGGESGMERLVSGRVLNAEAREWIGAQVQSYQTWGLNAAGAGRALYLLAGLVFLAVGVFEQYGRRRERLAKLPPGPFQWPYVGSLPHLLATAGVRSSARLREKVAALATKHGPLMFLQLAGSNILVVSSGQLAKEVSGNTPFLSLLPLPSCSGWRFVICGSAYVARKTGV